MESPVTSTVIHNVFKLVDSFRGEGQRMTFSSKAMDCLRSMCSDLFTRIIKQAYELMIIQKRSTLTPRDVQISVKITLAGDLCRHAVIQGMTALAKPQNASELKVRPSTLKRLMKATHMFPRIAKDSPVYLAAVLEYLLIEILELSQNVARNEKRNRIIPNHILIGIANDSELYELFKNCTIAGGGEVGLESKLNSLSINNNDNNNNNNNINNSSSIAGTATITSTTTTTNTYNVYDNVGSDSDDDDDYDDDRDSGNDEFEQEEERYPLPPDNYSNSKKSKIKAIPNFIIRGGDEYERCPICLQDLIPGSIAKRLNCKHVFHAQCIDDWAMFKHTCPVDTLPF